jgi:UDP-N-acetylmuramoylalanine--D-glutamate ligase
VDAKRNIVSHQTDRDVVVFNADHPLSRSLAATSAGAKLGFGLGERPDLVGCVEEGWIVCRMAGEVERIVAVDEVPLLGRFNLQNVLPAAVVGRRFGIPGPLVAQGVRTFRPLPHRLELVAEVDGVAFYNDSLATVPQAAQSALQAMSGRPVVLIAGGHDRGQDFAGLAASIVASDVLAMILFRPTGERLWDDVERAGVRSGVSRSFARTMDEAVDLAAAVAPAGSVVLMSPASASFGLFRDYRDRGERFRAAVQRMVERRRKRSEVLRWN